MADQKMVRLSQAAKKLNVGKDTLIEYLGKKGYEVKNSPNTKLSEEQYKLLEKGFASSKADKEEARNISIGAKVGNTVIESAKKEAEEIVTEEKTEKEAPSTTTTTEAPAKETEKEKPYSPKQEFKVLGTIDLDQVGKKAQPETAKSKKETEKVAPEQKEKATEQPAPKKEVPVEKKAETPENKNIVTPEEKKDIQKTPEKKVEKDVPAKPVQETKKESAPSAPTSKETTSKVTPQPESQKKQTKEKPEVSAKQETVSKEIDKKKEIKQPEAQAKKEDIKSVKTEETPETKKEDVTAGVAGKQADNKVKAEQTEPKNENKASSADSQKNIAEVKKEDQKKKEEDKKSTAVNPKADNMEVKKEETENQGQTVDKTIEAKADSLPGLKVLGKINLPEPSRGRKKPKPVASSDDKKDKGGNKRKRKRVPKGEGGQQGQGQGQGGQRGQGQGQGGQRGQGQGQGGQRGQGQGQGGQRGQGQGQGGQRGQGQGQGGQRGQQQGQGQQGGGEKKYSSPDKPPQNSGGGRKKGSKDKRKKEAISSADIKKGMKSVNVRQGAKPSKASRGRYRKDKREAHQAADAERREREMAEAAVLKVTEFVSTNEFATLMNVSVNEVIAKCMQLGMFISINQRLDKETISIIAEEFGFQVKFTSAEEEADVMIEEQVDKEEDLETRAPIVTIMGHVDHGKTSLLDYIRSANVAEGEAGGITQHIGAYDVVTESGRRIAFLDTPGHEAFTAMRARGAKLTDVAIIVIAADDSVMPQTVEAINHAQVAGVPIVFALNKCDKPAANPEKIKGELANINILVDSWGGKYQCYEISAKKGINIDELLEGVLFESDVLELKANKNKRAIGTIVEASLDKGRGYVSTVMVQAGTLKVGDIMLAGSYYGKVKAMTDHRANRMQDAGPSTPVQVLGLNGAPQAGDRLTIMETDKEARDLATKREQIQREQSIRATQRTTLDMLGDRIAQGGFQQLNIIVKGDVDGSVEALSDSLLKISTSEVEVRIIHKAVGAISESDIMLASADKDSEATTIVIGFQVRPTANARKIAEREGIEIKTYSVIYDAINEVKAAMEGMLSPDIEEVVVGNIEVREVFKISKVGTVAGCFVSDGYIKRTSKIRLIRDGIVIYGGEQGGEINALKRFKDDVSEVKTGYECGLSINNYNDIKVDDIIEVFEQKEVKRKLS